MNVVKSEIDRNITRDTEGITSAPKDTLIEVNSILIGMFLGKEPTWDAIKDYIRTNYKISISNLSDEQVVELLNSILFSIENDTTKKFVLASLVSIFSNKHKFNNFIKPTNKIKYKAEIE